MMRALALAATLTLGGCAYLSPVACGFSDADHVLAADAPLKAAWCRDHAAALGARPALATYCANIPTSVAGAVVTWGRVIAAWQAED